MISKFVVMTRPKPGQEDEYNDWYDKQHLSDMLTFPGFVDAQRFRFVSKINDTPHWEYCALYSVEGDDPESLISAMLTRVSAGEVFVSPAMADEVYAAVYEPVTDRIQSKS